MKKSLSYALWPEPPVPAEAQNRWRGPLKRLLISALSRLLRRRNLWLMQPVAVTAEARDEGRIWPGHADTMIGLKRLDNLQSCMERVIADDVPGDLIETGVWRGGSCIFMKAVLAAHGVRGRKVYVADSFAGLPEPEVERWPADRGDAHHSYATLAVSLEEVTANFRKYGLLDDDVVFLKGWFKDTLPRAPIQRLAILRLDGDMYGSTMDALTSLYPKLSPGGFCIVDDYALPPCRKAVEDYRARNGITAEIVPIDWTGCYWRA